MAAIAGTKNRLAIKTVITNAMSNPIINAMGVKSEANVRIGLPRNGIFPSNATLPSIKNRKKIIKTKPKNDPKTVVQFCFRKFIEFPTEKKTSPRNCSMVILEAIVLRRKKITAKATMPTHIAPVVRGFRLVVVNGKTGKSPNFSQNVCTFAPSTMKRER